MSWLAWRQFRVQALVVFTAVAVLAVALAATRPSVTSLQSEDPSEFLARFSSRTGFRVLYLLATAVVLALPVVVGAFWGAPLIAREVESGTRRLAWTQSVSRRRWLLSKMVVIGGAAVVVGSVSLLVSWWCGPLDETVNRSEPGQDLVSITRLSRILLGARGLVPLAYVVLALAIGVTVGLLLRRTVAAMALTVAAVIVVQGLTPVLLLPTLLPPVTSTAAITAQNLRGMFVEDNGDAHEIKVRLAEPGAWVLANDTIDANGNAVDVIPRDVADCTPDGGGERTSAGPTTACFDQLAAAGYQQRIEYQPADRYWTLQWLQTSVLLGLAGLLIGFCFRRITRDVT